MSILGFDSDSSFSETLWLRDKYYIILHYFCKQCKRFGMIFEIFSITRARRQGIGLSDRAVRISDTQYKPAIETGEKRWRRDDGERIPITTKEPRSIKGRCHWERGEAVAFSARSTTAQHCPSLSFAVDPSSRAFRVDSSNGDPFCMAVGQ